MESLKYVGLDVHRDTISVAVLEQSGKFGDAIDPGHARGGTSGFCARAARERSHHL